MIMSHQTFNTIIHARWLLTVESSEILHHHSLAIKDGQIAAIAPTDETSDWAADEVITLDEHVLMPGLINLHGHSAMTLLRGYADDLQLMDWLHNHIWPAEGKHVDDAFVYDGSLIGMAEMIRSGTTSINDMYFYHSAVARAGAAAGMRTFVGCSILEFPTNYAQNADEYISKAMAEREEYLNNELITFTLAPHAPYTVSDETFKKITDIALKNDMLVHCHIHETMDEVNDSVRDHGKRPLARLNDIGFLENKLIAAHMVHLTDDEIALTASKNISIAHNPNSNMKLASGIAPIAQAMAAGVNVGIGTDGAASNNKLDMLNETRQAALLAKVGTCNPTDVPSFQAIQMATINGAKALHIADKTGSIKVGKQADIIAINMAELETAPTFDVISHIVYAAGREHVTHTWVNGQCLMKQRQLLTLDETALKAMAKKWQTRIESTR
jgi:5-methylthioadenosine/S-adenosylhomocysteine deaminase